MKHVVLGLAVSAMALPVMAQEVPNVVQSLCGTDMMRQRLIAQDPSYLEREAAYHADIQRLIAENAQLRGGEDLVVTIPIVFHILHLRGEENIPDANILDQLEILNEDFRKLNADISQVIPAFQGIAADARIEFALPTKDGFGNCHNGIDRIQSVGTLVGDDRAKRNQWPRDKYLNVWVTRTMEGGVAGYAFYPDATVGFLQIFDGIILRYNYVSSLSPSSVGTSRALTHEIGHYLNLQHVWGNNNGEENPPAGHMASSCGDDGVEDTPLTKGWSGCPGNIELWKDCDPEIYENVQNYMEYSYCSKMFTEGQSDRMRAALNLTTADRNNLWSESNLMQTGVMDGHQASCPPEADFYAVVGSNLNSPSVPFTATTCVGTNVRFVDNSSRSFATSWAWSFQDGTPATSTQRNPTVQFNSPGFKQVTLTVTNANGSTTKTDDFAVLIGANSDAYQGIYFDGFESPDGIFPWVAANHDINFTTWEQFDGGGANGTNSCARLNSGDRFPLDIIDPNNYRDIDDMVSPLMNLSGLSSATLSFWYSYNTLTTDLEEVTERLEVFSSTDCGRTWQLRTTIDGEDLITSGTVAGPGPWAVRNIALTGSLLTDDVRFRFRFTSSDYSGDLYIDEVSIGAPVGMNDLEGNSLVRVFPNPTNDQFNIFAVGMEDSDTEVTIQDMRGALVYASVIAPTGNTGIVISARGLGLAEGMYVLRVKNAAGSSAQKLIIGR